jgi:hypothetical protein
MVDQQIMDDKEALGNRGLKSLGAKKRSVIAPHRAGWTFPGGNRGKAHYFQGNLSMCLRYSDEGYLKEIYPPLKEQQCKRCREKLERRESRG